MWNPEGDPYVDHNLFVLLDVSGNFYFAPSFSDHNSYVGTYEPGLSVVNVIPDFYWPENAGNASGILWYTLLMNSDMTEMVSQLGVFDFGWTD